MKQTIKPPLLEVENSQKYYPQKGSYSSSSQWVKALDGVSFTLGKGETLALVGESGCGKSTLARQIMALEQPTGGRISLLGRPLEDYSRRELQSLVQMIFQDPYGSLNPRKRAWELVAEPLLINTSLSPKECFKRAVEAMKMVGLNAVNAHHFPHMFSGGQRQRLTLARGLIQKPKILVCDEPVSALDVSIQAQVLNLLGKLKKEFQLSYLFISHDLNVVEYLADRIIVMYLGKIVEEGTVEEIFQTPLHPYTQALIDSTPSLNKKTTFKTIQGELPSPLDPPPGCAFHLRCPLAEPRCKQEAPTLTNHPTMGKKSQRKAACHLL